MFSCSTPSDMNLIDYPGIAILLNPPWNEDWGCCYSWIMILVFFSSTLDIALLFCNFWLFWLIGVLPRLLLLFKMGFGGTGVWSGCGVLCHSFCIFGYGCPKFCWWVSTTGSFYVNTKFGFEFEFCTGCSELFLFS